MPFDLDQLDRGEPVQPAGKASDLAVMAERGIDEGRSGEEACACARAIARTRCCCRKASSGWSAPPCSTCQKVQPLHDGAPCSAAPTLWIEPVCASQAIEPSARTARGPAALGIGQHAFRAAPARFRPAGRTRRAAASRLSATVCIALSSSGKRRGDALAGDLHIGRLRARSRSSAGPSRRATAPVVPVPKKGSSTTSPGFVQASRIR